MANALEQISTLRIYRKGSINEYVTGKMRVYTSESRTKGETVESHG